MSGQPVHAGEWQLTPSSQLTTGHVGNPRLALQGSDDELQNGAEIAAQLRGGGERLQLDVTPRATFSRNRSDRSLDTNNQFLGLGASWQNERSLWTMSALAARDSTQTSELGTTGLIQDNQRRSSILASAGPRWTVSENFSTGATVQWNDVRYADAAATGLADYSRGSASLYGTFATSDLTGITLNATAGSLEATNRPRPTRDAGLTLGLRHELGPLWSISLAAGPSWADSGLSTNRGTLYSASATRQGELLQFSATASRQLNPVGTGVLTEADGFQLSVMRRLSERFTATVSGQFTRNREIFNEVGVVGLETSYGVAAAAFNWAFARSWTLSLSVEERLQKVTTFSASSGSADGYRVWLGFGWNGRTLTL